jgi:predicted alpha-1,2-mannosidase
VIRRAGVLAAALLAVGVAAPAWGDDLASQVSPLSGSLGPGFPMVGASVPFGMIEPGPDTALAGGQQDPVNYDGYSYQDPDIRGFSLTHFDGAGIHIAGDLPFMPTTGSVTPNDPTANASPFDHATEVSQPGYYAVTLARFQTRVELTDAPRSALMRITYPAGSQANLLLEASQSISGQSPASVTVVGDHQLEGWVRSDVGYRVYFAAVFDRPFSAYGTQDGATLSPGSRQVSGRAAGAYVTFDTSRVTTVTMRVAISYLDQAGAAANLAAEIPAGRTFSGVRRAAHQAWNSRLGGALVSGGDPLVRQTFYDNLYRSLLMPSVFDDADGRYLGMDGQMHRVSAGHHHYSSLSLWDTYRTQTPVLELIEPRVASDVMTSLLDDYDQNHQTIPRWVQANVDRGIMGGDSGSATLAEGVVAGVLGGPDAQRALAALLHQAGALPPVWPREHLDAYVRQGYVGHDVSGIGAALTLEYAIDDFAVAQAARALGDSADAERLTARSGSWRNLMDPGSHFIRPRDSDGTWANPTSAGPAAVPWSPNFQDGYQEGTGWQYLWSAPHDVAGLAQAIGSPAEALRRLDSFFSAALNQPLVPAVPTAQQYASFFGIYYIGDQYTPANEPDLWAPWYYDWLGQPWKTERVVRAEMSTYNPRPDGMPGNDDTGTMSAWYVLAALGLYHATPGATAWELNSPAFSREVLRLGSKRSLTIDAPGASAQEPYVLSAMLGGAPLARTYVTTCELETARTLAVALSPVPTDWGTGPGGAPPSLSDTRPAPQVTACPGPSPGASPPVRGAAGGRLTGGPVAGGPPAGARLPGARLGLPAPGTL